MYITFTNMTAPPQTVAVQEWGAVSHRLHTECGTVSPAGRLVEKAVSTAGPTCCIPQLSKAVDMVGSTCCVLQECWAFDGGKNLLTSGPVQLKGGAQLPVEMDQRLVVTVRDVPADGSGKKASWQVHRWRLRLSKLTGRHGCGAAHSSECRLSGVKPCPMVSRLVTQPMLGVCLQALLGLVFPG